MYSDISTISDLHFATHLIWPQPRCHELFPLIAAYVHESTNQTQD